MRRTEAIAAVVSVLNSGRAFVVETTGDCETASISHEGGKTWLVDFAYRGIAWQKSVTERLPNEYQAVGRYLDLLVSLGIMRFDFTPVDVAIMARDGFVPEFNPSQGRDYGWCIREQERRDALPKDSPRQHGAARLYR